VNNTREAICIWYPGFPERATVCDDGILGVGIRSSIQPMRSRQHAGEKEEHATRGWCLRGLWRKACARESGMRGPPNVRRRRCLEWNRSASRAREYCTVTWHRGVMGSRWALRVGPLRGKRSHRLAILTTHVTSD